MSDPAPLDCAEAERRMRRHLTEALPTAQGAELRAHLAGCEGCAALWRELAETTAVLGRASRERRTLTRGARDELARRPPDPDEARATKRNRTRLLLYPSLLALVLFGLGKRLPLGQGASVEALMGQVLLSGEPLPSGERATLGAGRAVETLGDGGARVRLRGAGCVLRPNSRLRLERLQPLGLELATGGAELEGQLVLRTPHGLVESEDGARVLVLVGRTSEVRVQQGTALVRDAGGARTLHAGEGAQLPLEE